MSRKAFHIGIDLDIHAVSCPGVWLCPRGDATLKISMLGASAHTKRVEPVFPLLFHESFHFRKTLTGVGSLAGLQDEMTKRSVLIQLIQWQVHGCRCVVLASFRSSVSELLYPQPAAKNLLAGVDIDLLMETTACFPGIIAPKVEISTKVVIEEMLKQPNNSHTSQYINHKTVTSKRPANCKENKLSMQKSVVRPKIRQKPVCHTRPNVRCYYCKQRVERPKKSQVMCVSSPLPRQSAGEDTIYTPYCNKCGDIVEENEVKQGKIIMKEGAKNDRNWETACPCSELQDAKTACNCNLCRKYDILFKKSPPNINYCITKISDWGGPSPRHFTKDKLPCSCVCTKAADKERDSESDLVLEPRDSSRNEDYKKLLQADLTTHYKKLYERVSYRSNRRES